MREPKPDEDRARVNEETADYCSVMSFCKFLSSLHKHVNEFTFKIFLK